MAQLHHRCPECGDRDHLYGRADVRWDFDRQEWTVGDMEDQIECTECDWSGTTEQTVFEDDDDADARRPINRRPKGTCPDSRNHGEG